MLYLPLHFSMRFGVFLEAAFSRQQSGKATATARAAKSLLVGALLIAIAVVAPGQGLYRRSLWKLDVGGSPRISRGERGFPSLAARATNNLTRFSARALLLASAKARNISC